jgi:hypothetical protein
VTTETATMIDAIHDDVARIPVSAPKVAGYVTGTADIAWTAADWDRFPKAGHVRINQGHTWSAETVLACDVLDVEAHAVTAAEAADGVRARIAAGIEWTTIYGSESWLAEVVNALKALGASWYLGHVDCWLAEWNLSLAEAAALIGTEIHGLTCRAVQWASPTSNPSTLVPGSSLTLKEANVDLSETEASWKAYVAPAPAPAPAATQHGYLVTAGALGAMTGRAVSSADGKTWS